MSVCLQPDDFLHEKTYWFAELSNGEIVYQDDNRPGLEPSAWVRLGKYVRENDLRIVALSVRFRSHIERLPRDCAAYYFSKGACRDMTSPKTVNTLVLGYQATPVDSFKCLWYKCPELIVVNEVIKSPWDVKEPFVIYGETTH